MLAGYIPTATGFKPMKTSADGNGHRAGKPTPAASDSEDEESGGGGGSNRYPTVDLIEYVLDDVRSIRIAMPEVSYVSILWSPLPFLCALP